MSNLPLRLLVFLITSCVAWGVTIQYEVADLPDVTAGENLMRYHYSVSGISFDAYQSFDILFDEALYTKLDNATAPGDFDVLVLQPDLALSSAGHYEAMALIPIPSLIGLFQVDFVYLSAGQPGSQTFFINQYDENGDLISVISQGTTVPFGEQIIPEPSTLTFVVGGLAGAALMRRRRRG